MLSANSGKHIVKNIKVSQKHITVMFFKGEKIQISPEAYLTHYLYKGKALSEDEIKQLLAITSSSTLLSYALNLVSRKSYSEAEIVGKLQKKGSDKQSTAIIVAKLKASNLINDKLFAQNLVAFDGERNYGKNKIIRHLKDKGIPEEMINALAFPLEGEQQKAEQMVLKMANKYASLAYENQKRHVYQALVAWGFSYDIAHQALNSIKKVSQESETAKLLNDYQTLVKRFSRKYNGYELKQRIFRALANKGYQYQDIKEVMEDLKNENDC